MFPCWRRLPLSSPCSPWQQARRRASQYRKRPRKRLHPSLRIRPWSAHAKPSGSDRAWRARGNGRTRWPPTNGSAELRPHSVTSYNIGYVERALGHLTRARQFLTRALEPTAGAGLDPLPEDLQGQARAYLIEIDRKLARVSVTLADPRIAVSIDGRPLEVLSTGERPLLSAGIAAPGRPVAPPAARFDLLIDPGRHVVLLSLPGTGETLSNHSFSAGSTTALTLAVGERPHAAPASAPVPRARPVDERAAAPANLRPWMWTAFGVGAAGIAAGSVFGILAINKEADLAKKCPVKSQCPHQDDQDQLDNYALGADIGFGVGIVGLGVGTTLWFLDKRQEKPPLTAQSHPQIGVSRNGLWMHGHF